MIALAAALALAATPRPDVGDTLWRSPAATLAIGSCAGWPEPGPDCKTLELWSRRPPVVLGSEYGYVNVLWRSHDGSAPPIVVYGGGGGSAGCGDIISVWRDRRHVRRQVFRGCHTDGALVVASPHGLRLLLPITVAGLRNGSNADTIVLPLPLGWTPEGFALDPRLYGSGPDDAVEEAVAAAAVRDSLALAARDVDYGSPGYTAAGAATALVELMLRGKAPEARHLLDQAWPGAPGPLGDKQAFWRTLCASLANDDLWRTLRLAERLPHAEVIEAGARGGLPH